MVAAVQVRHGLHGPPFDYFGLAVACAASWIGIPGPGEPVLVAAGILAAKGKLDIGGVLAVAFLSAMVAGIAGWAIGFKAGRAVFLVKGPLRQLRERAVRRGDEVFARYTVLAIVLTPTWIAGIHRVRAALYLPVTVISAAVWAVGIGLGAYLAGPAILDFLDDLDTVAIIGLVFLVGGALVSEFGWRRRRRRHKATATGGRG